LKDISLTPYGAPLLILPPEDNVDELGSQEDGVQAEQNVVASPEHVAYADDLQIIVYEAGFQQHDDENVDNAMNSNVWLFFTLGSFYVLTTCCFIFYPVLIVFYYFYLLAGYH
jgi:hypothetical protein